MPSSSTQRPRRNGLFLFFVLIAVIVVGGIAWYQHHHSTEIVAPASEIDSMALRQQEAGESFLAAKAKEPGIKSLGGGLLYREIKAGSGNSPTGSSTVVTDYEGRLIDGTVFDSSFRRGKPAEFQVSGVIPGWQVALKAMKPGAEWEVYIPQYMAYGKAGSGENIPPYSALVFRIVLHSVKQP